MWHHYSGLAEQRLQELYDDAAVRRSLPPRDRRRRGEVRAAIGHTLVRWGERLAPPAGSPVAPQ